MSNKRVKFRFKILSDCWENDQQN